MIGPPLQSPVVARATVLLAFLAIVLAVGLAVLVAVRALVGYRATRDPGLLWLGGGIVLVGAGQPLVNLVLTNWTRLAPAAVRTATDGVALLGLAAVLAAIYWTGGEGRGRAAGATHDGDGGPAPHAEDRADDADVAGVQRDAEDGDRE